MDSKSVENFLCSIPPFSELPREVIREATENSLLRSFRTREIIFLEGDSANAAYLVFSGRVAMLKSSPNGKELILELIPSGNLFGVVALLDVKPYPLTARAQVDSQILVLSRDRFLPIVKRFPELQRGFMSVITGRMQGAQNLARALAHDRVEIRVASILLELIPNLARNNSSQAVIDLQISRNEIADLAGITLETASRVIKGFERENVIDASRFGFIQIREPGALREITTGD